MAQDLATDSCPAGGLPGLAVQAVLEIEMVQLDGFAATIVWSWWGSHRKGNGW